MTYEVEIRFVAKSTEEAFRCIPFLEESLSAPKEWSSDIIGRSIFDDGRLLRLGWSQSLGSPKRGPQRGPKRWGMGYKGPDLGEVANIREEWGESVTDGITNSAILAQLDITGSFDSPDGVLAGLAAAGYEPFMRFTGVDRLGYHEPMGIHTKLAQCSAILDDQFLVELEMEAATLEEARSAEARLLEVAETYGVRERLTRDEPPTMLFKRAS